MQDLAVFTPSGSTTVDRRAAALRDQLADGAALRVTAFGQPELRAPGRKLGSPALDAVRLGITEGWLVEHDRRALGYGRQDQVTYRLDASAVPEPIRVAETRRAKRRPRTGPSRPPGVPTTPQPLADGTECVPLPDVCRRWGVSTAQVAGALKRGKVDRGGYFLPAGAGGQHRASLALTERTLAYAERVWVRGERAKPPSSRTLPSGMKAVSAEAAAVLAAAKPAPRFPTAPPPMPDGTECLRQEDAVERWGASRKAVQQAIWRGRVDAGTRYRPESRPGQPSVSLALTPQTLAYAEAVWVRGDRRAFAKPGRHGGPVGGQPLDGQPPEFVEGEEVTRGDLARRLGYATSNGSAFLREIAAVPSRYVHPTNHRRGRLFRAGPELAEAAARLGVAVTISPAPVPGPPQPPTEVGASGDGHWSSLLPEPVATETPVFA